MSSEITIFSDNLVEYTPAKLELRGKEELVKQANEYIARYTGVDFISNAESIKGDKQVLADLRSKAREINQARIDFDKAYKEPLDKFDQEIKSVAAIYNDAIKPVSKAVNDYENKILVERKNEVMDLVEKVADEYQISIDDIEINPKWWTNNSYGKTKRENEIIEQAQQVLEQKKSIAKSIDSVTDITKQYNMSPEPYIKKIEQGETLSDVFHDIQDDKKQADRRREQEKQREEAQQAAVQAELEKKTVQTGNKRVDKATGEVITKRISFWVEASPDVLEELHQFLLTKQQQNVLKFGGIG